MVTGNDSSGSEIMYDLLNTRAYGKSQYTKGILAKYEKNAMKVAEKIDKMGFDVTEDWQNWMSIDDINEFSQGITDADALKFLAEIYDGV